MMIYYDPDEYEIVAERHTCPYHLKYPGAAYAGCTCSANMGQRRRAPEEIAAIKERKIREEEDRVLAQAEIIKASRAKQ